MSPLHEHGPPTDPPAGGAVKRIKVAVGMGVSVFVGANVAVLARVGDADAVSELVRVNVGRETAVCVSPMAAAVSASGLDLGGNGVGVEMSEASAVMPKTP